MSRGINWLNTYFKIHATILTSTIQKQYYHHIITGLESNGKVSIIHLLLRSWYKNTKLLTELYRLS
jgi:hypothetical protein